MLQLNIVHFNSIIIYIKLELIKLVIKAVSLSTKSNLLVYYFVKKNRKNSEYN